MDKIQILVTICCCVIAVALFVCLWKVLNWVWFRPKKLEKLLRKQGLKGNSYRILYGDMKDFSGMIKEANSKPMNISNDDLAPRLVPFFLEIIKKYGKFSNSDNG